MSEIDFTHRIEGDDISNTVCLADTVGMMTYRATGILQVISVNLDSDNRVSDEHLKGAIDSAIAEIKDIDAMVQTFNQAQAKGGEK